MKKIFLTGALTACLLFNGCGDGSAESESVDFHAKEKPAVETHSVDAQSHVVTLKEKPALNKQQIDWDSAPRFDNFEALVEYLNNCKNALQTWQPVVCVDGFKPDSKKIVDIRPMHWLSWTDYGNGRILYEMTNYPGERVAYAYTHGDTSFLSDEERRLYDVAVQIVNDAKNFSDDLLYQELYLHDEIAKRAKYYNKNPQPKLARFQTAAGALIDGKANCQGYADAFYMLATMCGLETDKVSGIANNEIHVWNTVNFGDVSYFVDVTWDDGKCVLNNVEYNNYIYFNAPTDVIGSDHKWYTAHVPKNLQRTPDGRNFYHSQAYHDSGGRYFGGWSRTPEDALGHIAYRIAKQGYKVSWIEAPYNAKYADVNKSLDYVLDNLTDYGWYGNVSMTVTRCGKRLYFVAKGTPNR